MASKRKSFTKLISLTLIFALIITTLGTGVSTPVVNASELQQAASKLPDPKPVELPQYRNETTKVFGNPDGTYTAEVYSEPVHYQDGNRWADIDNTLITAKDNAYIENKSNKFSVKFPQNTQGEDFPHLFNYSISGHDISVGLASGQSENQKSFTNPVNAVRNLVNQKVSYSGIYPGVKFEYVVDGSKVKENIILDSYQGKNTFEFFIQGTGLKAVKKDNGYIEFTDNNSGEFLFNIPKPFMVDSNKDNGSEGITNMNVNQVITAVKGGFLLTITADESFLKDTKTAYPVTIDPWIDDFNATDTYIASANSYNYNTNGWLYVGNDATIGITRSLVRWGTLPDIPNATITDAKIGIMQQHEYLSHAPVEVHQVISDYNMTTVNWASQPSYKSAYEYKVDDFSGNYDYFMSRI